MVMHKGILAEQDASHLNSEALDSLRIHSIETFGTHDGPGIRLVIFLQGCQFRCIYCANPDTLNVKGGTFMAIDDIVKHAIAQTTYFGKKGGVTVTGGEPLLQRSRVKELFKKLHAAGINTALDSNGKLLNAEVAELLEETDLLLLDIKHINNDWHHKITGLGNEGVLKLAAHRESTGRKMWLRYVLVPGYSDQPEYIHEMGKHFADYKTIERVQILPYHKLGVHKWQALGMQYQLEGVEPPTEKAIEEAKQILEGYFSDVTVG
jgi:pyruvate formate lyase activating enzyme